MMMTKVSHIMETQSNSHISDDNHKTERYSINEFKCMYKKFLSTLSDLPEDKIEGLNYDFDHFLYWMSK